MMPRRGPPPPTTRAEMEFRFAPLVWQGCDEVVNDLIAARERRKSRPEVYAAKLARYVKSGGNLFERCVAEDEEKAREKEGSGPRGGASRRRSIHPSSPRVARRRRRGIRHLLAAAHRRSIGRHLVPLARPLAHARSHSRRRLK